MRKERKYNYIYKTTCIVTNRYYIGMHSTNNLDDGYLGSGKRLWFSIKYHGRENHIREIIEYCDNRDVLKKREEEIVNLELLCEDLCMNLKTGGQGGFSNEEHMIKATKAGAKSTNEKRWLKNREENIILASDNFTKLWKDGVFTGRDMNGDKNPMFGKQHTEEAKNKMSNSGIGENNSQYGTCWVCKGNDVKKIKKRELDSYIKNGWIRGRKVK